METAVYIKGIETRFYTSSLRPVAFQWDVVPILVAATPEGLTVCLNNNSPLYVYQGVEVLWISAHPSCVCGPLLASYEPEKVAA